jgi:CheY-like chemotaxis protein
VARILVVDDEPLVRTTLVRLLQADHDVVCVADGGRALALLRSGEHFDVILCDLSMPEVGGGLVYFESGLLAPQSTKRFVFMYGGATTERDRQLIEGLDQPRLEKPFTIAELRAAIDEVLDASG